MLLDHLMNNSRDEAKDDDDYERMPLFSCTSQYAFYRSRLRVVKRVAKKVAKRVAKKVVKRVAKKVAKRVAKLDQHSLAPAKTRRRHESVMSNAQLEMSV
ncbi:hypothetical protein FHG87_005910 [Trinorchestia longiramus]|nr:hypothetical protein FHG87_005910 [Trinorchestia longiramus]